MRSSNLDLSYLTSILLLLPNPILAVSLSSFIPEIPSSAVSGQCLSVYDAEIPGCTSADFKPPNVCSKACLQGLVTTNSQVNAACKGQSVDPNSIIGLILQGKGIQALCDVDVVTATTTMNGVTGATNGPGGNPPVGPNPTTAAASIKSLTTAGNSQNTATVLGPPSTLVLSVISSSSSLAHASSLSSISPSVVTASAGSSTTSAKMTSTTMTKVITSGSKTMTMTVVTAMAQTTPTPQAEVANNPSKPTCQKGGQSQSQMGDPFNAFNDQLCSSGNALRVEAGSWKRWVIGSVVGMVGLVLVWG